MHLINISRHNMAKILSKMVLNIKKSLGLSWSWWYSNWIYNYQCNQCLSPLMLWVRTTFMARCTWNNIMW